MSNGHLLKIMYACEWYSHFVRNTATVTSEFSLRLPSKQFCKQVRFQAKKLIDLSPTRNKQVATLRD